MGGWQLKSGDVGDGFEQMQSGVAEQALPALAEEMAAWAVLCALRVTLCLCYDGRKQRPE